MLASDLVAGQENVFVPCKIASVNDDGSYDIDPSHDWVWIGVIGMYVCMHACVCVCVCVYATSQPT